MAQPTAVRTVAARTASTVRLRVPHWLWEKRIPAGQMTLLAGREGIGKSSVALKIAADVTRGDLVGRYLGRPRSVGIVATEDDWGSTIVPRLMAAGADLERVYQVEAFEDGAMTSVSVPDDLEELKQVVADTDMGMLIVDPIMSVIPSQFDAHKDREVRKALDPLVKFAQQAEVAVLGLIHVNKSAGTDALNTVMGSRAFAAVARSVLFAIKDEEAEEGEDAYLLGHPKSNLGPKMPSVTYRLLDAKISVPDGVPPDDVIETSKAILGGEDSRTVGDILTAAASPGRSQGQNANELQAYIEAAKGVVRAGELADAFPELSRKNLDITLKRMSERGVIDKVARGVYQKHTRSNPTGTSYIKEVVERVVSVGSNTTDTTKGTLPKVWEAGVGNDEWPSIPPPNWDDEPPYEEAD